jgi:hypothetical protein
MEERWTARALATWDHGFHLPVFGLWLDPRGRVELGFASDALGGGLARRVIATPETVRFLRRRRRRAAPTFLPSPAGRSFLLGEAELRLLAAGPLPGAAQLEVKLRGGTLLYLRRILPEPVGLGGVPEAPRADAVLVDAPGAVAPQACSRRADTVAAIRAWVERAQQNGEIPVLLVEPFTAGPALAAQLGRAGYELRMHSTIHETVRLCAAAGVPFERAWRLAGAPRIGQVVLLPWSGAAGEGADAAASSPIAKLHEIVAAETSSPHLRVAVVHDGSLPPRADLRPDEVFLLAFTAGVSEIVSHVQRTGAAEVLLSPETPVVVGSVLRELGVARVERLGPPEQLGLRA